MGADAPQWLFSSFVDAMQEIGASAPIPLLEAEARDLISRWNAKGRILHNTRHLIKTLARIDEIASTAHDPDVLRVALWYQGAVINRSFDVFQRGTNSDEQEFSALYHARSRMEALGLSEDVISRVQELMMALFTHRADPSDMDAQVLIDADLGMLAASPQDFKRFRESLREECPDLCDMDYVRARRLAIKKILAREQIFHSPLALAWEESARANLEAESAKLARVLKAYAPDADLNEPEEDVEPEEHHETLSSDTPASGTMIIRRRHLNIKSHTEPFDPVDAPSTPAESLPSAVVELPKSTLSVDSDEFATDEAAGLPVTPAPLGSSGDEATASVQTPSNATSDDAEEAAENSVPASPTLPPENTETPALGIPSGAAANGAAAPTSSGAAVPSAQQVSLPSTVHTPLPGVAAESPSRGSAADADDTSSLESALDDLDIPTPPPLS
ncbi:hypothetical protein [Actinomyces sp. oral taxon 181]|uniref:HD domain-containing protein n=1 Tax=Actinomyces sp. oral taxon 181 TaxID=712121 RepID=UPI0025BD1C74|nr:hypothetical protein [Actinomyces sp. oral taxon 181]MBS5749864.1 hypothetical protein [Actinomyces sp. oral taxon 181]